MIDSSSRKYNEEFKRFKANQPAPLNNPSSRYLEYRKREQLALDKMEHPEKYIPEQPKIDITPEPRSVVSETPVKKKSWFSKTFG